MNTYMTTPFLASPAYINMERLSASVTAPVALVVLRCCVVFRCYVLFLRCSFFPCFENSTTSLDLRRHRGVAHSRPLCLINGGVLYTKNRQVSVYG